MQQDFPTSRWQAKPITAGVIRVGAVGMPIALAIATGWLTSRLFGQADSVGDALLRIATTAITSMVVLNAADRVGRRFTPLAALYRFSLVFPDHAPSRFGVALRSGNSRRLERRIADARDGIDTVGDHQGYFETMLELVAALNRHDRLTRGHCERTRAHTEIVIDELDLPTADADRLRWAALLHDIGKLGVDTEILNSTGRPTDAEWAQLRAHPEIGERLAAPIADFLGPWMSAISQHHERFDGGGYPAGLGGHDIHLGGRIVAVTDAYDVMTSTRSYKKPMSASAAREELVRCAGTQFDPAIVRAFLAASLGKSRVSVAPLGALFHLREAFAILLHTPIAAAVSTAGSAASVASATGAAVVATAALTGVALTANPPETAPDPAPVAPVEFVSADPSVDERVIVPERSTWSAVAWSAAGPIKPTSDKASRAEKVEKKEKQAEMKAEKKERQDEKEASKAEKKAAKDEEKARGASETKPAKPAKDQQEAAAKDEKQDAKQADKAQAKEQQADDAATRSRKSKPTTRATPQDK